VKRGDKMENEQMAFQLILHAGNAKSSAMEAIIASNNYDFETANECIEKANEELTIAHKAQYDLLSDFSNGEKVDVNILMVHAQDHVSGASLIIEMAKEIITLNNKIYLIEQKGER
jgi:PTS system cellobiose-specific IIA component